MSPRRLFKWSNIFVAVVFLLSISPVQAAPETAVAQAPLADTPSNWCVAGGFQGWNNASTPLFDDGTNGDLIPNDQIFTRTVTITDPGPYEWKVFQCGSWSPGFPTNNTWLVTNAASQNVTFTFETNDHTADSGLVMSPKVNAVNVEGDNPPTSWTAVGSFNGWSNDDPNTLMDSLGDGIYRKVFTIQDAGSYEGKVTETGSWDRQFAADGRSIDGGNLSFSTTTPNQQVVALLDVNTGKIAIQPNGISSGPWCAAGTFQNPAWDPDDTILYDDGTNGDLVGGDGLYSRDVTVASIGTYEWKVTNCSWNMTYPQNNSWLITSQPGEVVKLTFDTSDHTADVGTRYIENQYIVNAWDSYATLNIAGSFESWNNADPATTLARRGNQDFLAMDVPAGAHVYMVARTGSWHRFGIRGREVETANRVFNTTASTSSVRFLHNPFTGRTALYVPPQTAAHDNNIWWSDLGHNSRETIFRTPAAAVETGNPVTLRFRAAAGDLTAAQVRLYNDRTNAETLLNMTLAASDAAYEWWEASMPASPVPTVYWYRFIAIDGTATAYYEDDSARTGGWGQTYADSPDISWQLTVYDPSFQTPDWVKNAVIYQIFPDRFRDGVPANNTDTGSFFYDEAGGTIERSLSTDWNTVVCDPRAVGACSGTYSKNFYGGDLAGITQQLPYLDSLGVTAIYLNPIFESPSNHKYDTTDYLQIDDNFGTLQDFTDLADAAELLGIRIILDGVFNHTSSDSIYFDRYHRYGTAGIDDNSGACEGGTSPYYNWFYFPAVSNAGQDGGVPATCLNGPSDDPQTYEAWFGYSSLPKLQANSTQARDLIWAQPDSVARYWLEQGASGWRLDVGGDVDPGVTADAANDYWEGFRDALHAVDPDAYIVGEEWGNASSWLLGQEWDATMNYQYSSAMLSFWRDTTFVDNDHNSGSSAGELTPLTPQQLDDRLHNLIERYPPEALYAMMNLLGSHDTNRALFMLDGNTSANNTALYLNPAYDWSDAITRLKGVTILQMTLPGAPTIYYGDEVGLVGPPAYDGSSWQDDPYNRQPYPWLDQTGLPYYDFLQSAANQAELRDYFTSLTSARNAHPALRTGSFDTLKIDDANKVYAYGRRMADFSDAAVVVLNRQITDQSVTVNVAGYLPIGALFTDILTGTDYTVSAGGALVVTVPQMSGAVLVYEPGIALTPPAAPANLIVTNEGSGTITLSWDAIAGADEYQILRSPLSGGGFVQIGTSAAAGYTDTDLTNAQYYYYIVRARNTATGLVSGDSNQAQGMPHLSIGWAGNLSPTSLTKTIGVTPSDPIYAQVWIDGVTSLLGPAPTLWVQIGFGVEGSLSSTWTTWKDASFDTNVGNNDQFAGTLIPEHIGIYDYTYRFSTTNGRDWTYLTEIGKITVTISADTTPSAAPTNLRLADFGRSFLTLTWDAPADIDVYAYDIFRSDTSGSGFVKIGRILDPAVQFTDSTVTTGETYYFHVVALDTSFNISAPSNELQAVPAAKMVDVTLNAAVPAVSPGTVYFTRSVNPDNTLGDWSPNATPMTASAPNIRTTTFTLEEGTLVEFKFTRGSWETVEKDAAGAEISNRSFTVDFGTTGTQTVNLTVENWRDPLVIAFTPAENASVPTQTPLISFTWSKSLPVGTTLAGQVTAGGNPVPGTLSYDDPTRTVTFTPDSPLPFNQRYLVTVSGQAAGGDLQQVPTTWTFWVGYRYWFSIIFN